MSDKLISVKDLSVDFVSADYEINAVNNISFDINAGETLAIVGESGSGKSVTAMSLMRLHEEKAVRYKGSIHFQQQDVLQLASSEMQSLRGSDIAMIFQEPMTSLNPVFTVGDQVSETLILHQNLTKEQALRIQNRLKNLALLLGCMNSLVQVAIGEVHHEVEDMKQMMLHNCLNNNGHGVIPVAVLSRDDFDATQVDPLTVRLDGQEVRVVGKKGNVQAHHEDVNTDGLVDIVLQIADEDGIYAEGDAIAILTGETFSGTAIQGTDNICIVP